MVLMKRKKILKVLGIIFGVIFLLCIIGGVWNSIAAKNDVENYPPEGQMVEVIDSNMHVFSSGSRGENEPAIVLISGLSTPSPVADYYPLWNRLNDEHFVVVLERPGYGWSESTDEERTLDNIVNEDVLALKNAGIEPPYLLVAHSIGGIEAHLFAATYPDDVDGILLLDSMSPDLYVHYGETSVPLLNKVLPPLRSIGLLRLMDTVFPSFVSDISRGSRNNFEYVDLHYDEIDRIMLLSKNGEKNMLAETKNRYKNAEIASKVTIPSDIPVTLVIPNLAESKELSGFENYMEYEENWGNQSSNGKIVDLKGEHYIHQYDPDGVCNLIEELFEEALR